MKGLHAEFIDEILTEICNHSNPGYINSGFYFENSNRIYSKACSFKIIDRAWVSRRANLSDVEFYCDLVRTINLINLDLPF